MGAQPKLNIAAIIGIKDGIYQVFASIDQNLDAYNQQAYNDKFIKDCRNYIHQLNGLLEMLNVTSLILVIEKIEQLLDALITKKTQPNPAIVDALKQSAKALLFYLNELIDGVEENPLRLYPAYRTLMQAYGFENAPESDLFFPRLATDPALKPETVNIDAPTVKSLAKQLGTEYQAGLLKWLRDPEKPDGLQQMAGIIHKIEAFPGTTEQRAFWWVAAGFLEDLLQQNGNLIDLPVRRLCGKIEQTIRHLAAGAIDNTTVLMRELLYHIAQSESDGERIGDIRRSYIWPGQTTNTDTLTFEQSEALNPVLERLRSTLMQANDIWREYCAGQQDSLVSLSEYVDWLALQARQTECPPLIRLVDAIGNTTTYLHAQPQDMSEELAMEMATALLLIESIIDDFNKLSPDLPNQVDILISRLLGVAAADVSISELPAAPSFDTMESNTQEKELINQVCQEILGNLSQIEIILDRRFFESAQRDELSRLSGLFNQISGALVMLTFEHANSLLNNCYNLVEKLMTPNYEIIETEQILLVDGLSSLGFFVEAYRSGQPGSQNIIEEAIALFHIAATAPASIPTPLTVSAAPITATSATVSQQESVPAAITAGADSELLDVFLAEADQVLADIEAGLHQCRIDAANREALMNLRRGFHTLKGSGRMVKLDTMSEVAWYLEQVLTRYLSDKTPASEPLLSLVAYTHQAYTDWCAQLRKQGTVVDVNSAPFVSAAKQLLAKQTTVQPPLQDQAADPAVASTKKTAPPAGMTDQQPIKPTQDRPTNPQADDSINPELLQVFLEETHDIVPQIGNRLRAWRMLPQDEDIHRALLRLLHTLKGSARMAGALQLGELIHAMESHIAIAFLERNISIAALDQLETEFDAIGDRIEQLPNSAPISIAYDAAFDAIEETIESTQAIPEKTESPQSKTILRINSELIDRLVADSGEVNMLRAKIETQLNSFKQSLQDLGESTHRLHDQLREVEIQAETQMQSHLAQQSDHDHTFDPLEFDRFTRLQELTRLMAESIDDIITVQKNLRASHIIAEEATSQQSTINRQLQQSLLQIRTLPFSNFAERYYRITRQVADEMDKKIQLQVHGGEVEIDRNILEKINPPLEHILRNAIAHGIENPEQRLNAGKAETGQITIRLRQTGNEVIITLSDDGAGLNLPRIHEQACRLGLVQQDESLDEDKIVSMIFTQGLSTTDSITGNAGRGIGLDVVKNEIALLGGRISVHSTPRHGTTFTISLPFTLSVAQIAMVQAGTQTYAIPALIVEHRQEFSAETMRKIYQDHHIELHGKKYLFAHLSHLLGEPHPIPENTKQNSVLFLHSGTQYLAVHVDQWRGDMEVAVKNAGPQMVNAPGIEGATITGDGEVILILNPVKLLQRNDVKKVFNTPLTQLAAATMRTKAKTPAVMVVDDSLTVRKVTCRLLEREGCEILIAKNGSDALGILQETIPDVMLVDLEMPKMNGFELIRRIRKNPKTTHIPIIIISSRTAEKHQKIAKDLGVNVFLGKPYKEEQLLSHLYQLGFSQSS